MPDLDPAASPDDDLATSEELRVGLSHLVASVDVDAATAAFARLRRRRATRRRAVVGMSALAVVLVGALATSAAVGSDDRRGPDRVLAGPGAVSSTTPGETSKEQNGLHLEVDAPTSGKLGTRVRLTVRLSNVSADPIQVRPAWGCDGLVDVELVPAGDPARPSPPSPGRPGPWDGAIAGLPGVLAEHGGDPTLVARSVLTGSDGWDCLMMSPDRSLAPGEEVVQQMLLDLRWGVTDLAPAHELLVRSVASGEHLATGPTELRVPFALEDDPRRLASLDEARSSTGLATAPTLADWVVLTKAPGRLAPGAVQSYEVDLTWWQGYWELWIIPRFVDGNVFGSLRIRWEAARGRVSEVRMVASFLPPEDDPDAPAREGRRPDQIRFHLD